MKALDLALRESLTPLASRAAAVGIDIVATRQAVLSLVKDNPRLAQCTTRSICEAVAKAVYLGLDLAPAAQEAYLTPRKSRAVLVPDYRGLLKLAYQNPRVACVESRVVCLRDDFTLDFGDPMGRIVRHRPYLKPLDDNEVNPAIGAYAIVWWKDCSQPLVEWMTKEQIEANAERGGNSEDDSPWQTDWAQMARKTVLKRLLNYVPLGKSVSEQLRAESEGEEGEPQQSSESEEPVAAVTLVDEYMASITSAAPEGIDAVIAAIRQDDRLDHREKTELFNAATARKREMTRQR